MPEDTQNPLPGAAEGSVSSPSDTDVTTVSPYEQMRAKFAKIPAGLQAKGDIWASVIMSLSTLDQHHHNDEYYPLCEMIGEKFGQSPAIVAAEAERARRQTAEDDITHIISQMTPESPADDVAKVLEQISTAQLWIVEHGLLKQLASNTKLTVRGLEKDLERIRAKNRQLMTQVMAEADAAQQKFRDLYPDFPGAADIVVPKTYRIVPADHRIVTNTADLSVVTVSPVPITVIRRMRDADTGEVLLTVAVRERGRWHLITEQRQKFFAKGSLIELAGRGMPFSDTTARAGTRFLADAEVANAEVLPEIIGVSSLGWRRMESGERMFALGGRVLRQNESEGDAPIEVYAPEAGEQQLLDGFATDGTWEAWCEMAAMCLEYPRLMLGIYASLAAPLVQMTSLQGALIHFCGRTSKGKTTALQIGASVWGYPGGPQLSQHPGMIRSWNGTAAANEKLLAFLCHLPAFLDDLTLADPRVAADTVYACVNGQGRRRSNVGRGTRSTGSWNLIALSTGEYTTQETTQAGGLRVRAIDMWGDVFSGFTSTVGEESAANDDGHAVIAQDLRRRAGTNYGHAGERMIHALLLHDPIQLAASAQKELDRLVETVGAPARTDMGGRLAQAYGVMAVAAIILHTELVPAGSPLAQVTAADVRAFFARALAAQLTGADAPQHADVDAYEAIMGWAAMHSAHFLESPDVETKQPPQGWLGKWRVSPKDGQPGVEYVAIDPDALKAYLKASGHQYTAILKGMAEAGNLLVEHTTTQDGQPKINLTRNVSIGSGKQARMVLLPVPPQVDAVDEDSPSVEPQSSPEGGKNLF